MEHRARDNQIRGRISRCGRRAFTLLEVLVSLALLALISSSVLVVINRCMAATTDSALRMEAFRLARENLEKILAAASVEETIEYDASDRYPEVSCQTVIETFSVPLGGNMWVRAVCTAEYIDSGGEAQTIELIHWLAQLTDQQAEQVAQKQQQELDAAADDVVASLEEAAAYAGVDVETVEDWVRKGLVQGEDGTFIKDNLDVFTRAGGNPTAQEKSAQAESIVDLLRKKAGRSRVAETGVEPIPPEREPLTGLTYEELEKMSVREVMELLRQLRKQQ